MRLTITVVMTTVSLSACSGDGSGPAGQQATQLAFTAQPGAGKAGQVLAPPIQVSVQDASGALVGSAEHTVTLALENNPSGAALSGTTAVNASGGTATFSDIQISKAGAGYTLRASATALTGASSAAFDLAPVAGLATTVTSVDGDDQTGTVGEGVATRPSVRVTDGFGAPVANVGVTFSIGSGGGGAASPDQTTDGGGVATVGGWTLGTKAGVQTLLAAAPGLDGSPVTFTATATPGPPATLTKNAGDDQTTAVASAVPEPPSVLVTDSYENPVADVPVAFAATSGGGAVTGASQTTGTNGIATIGSWTLGDTPGSNSLTASAAGLAGSPVTFTAMATSLTNARTVEVRNHYFRSLRNGSGSEFTPTPFGEAAVDTIAVGGTVTWQWVGVDHNVTPYLNSAFTESGTHNAPFTFGPITFNTAGTYRYRCTNHSSILDFLGLVGMRGQIVVR